MASFTKKAIIDSFYKLLNQKKLGQITVKDIVTDCGVNRNSFYYYFEDIPSLISEEVSQLEKRLEDSYTEFNSIEKWMLHAVELANANKKIIKNCIDQVDSHVYKQYLNEMCRHIVNKHLEKMTTNLSISQKDFDLIVKLQVFEYTELFKDWVQNGMSEDITEEIKRICQLQHGHLEEMILRASQSNNNS